MTTNSVVAAIISVLVAMCVIPILAYFVAKFGAYGWHRGRALYQNQEKRNDGESKAKKETRVDS